MEQHQETATAGKKEPESLLVIGLFLGVFGVAVLVAIFFTDSFRGQITNLVCGLLFVIPGVIAVTKARRDRKAADKA